MKLAVRKQHNQFGICWWVETPSKRGIALGVGNSPGQAIDDARNEIRYQAARFPQSVYAKTKFTFEVQHGEL